MRKINMRNILFLFPLIVILFNVSCKQYEYPMVIQEENLDSTYSGERVIVDNGFTFCADDAGEIPINQRVTLVLKPLAVNFCDFKILEIKICTPLTETDGEGGIKSSDKIWNCE